MRMNDQGFILLEVMLAMTVFVVGAAMVFQSFHTSLQVFRQARELYAGTLLIEGQSGQLQKTGRWASAVATDPRLGTLRWNWTEPDITLAWGEGKHANALHLRIHTH